MATARFFSSDYQEGSTQVAFSKFESLKNSVNKFITVFTRSSQSAQKNQIPLSQEKWMLCKVERLDL